MNIFCMGVARDLETHTWPWQVKYGLLPQLGHLGIGEYVTILSYVSDIASKFEIGRRKGLKSALWKNSCPFGTNGPMG